jgi:GNAT superfamily N-acetyltransferase
MASTFVVCEDSRVIGFYTLATAGVAHADAPPRIARGVPRHAIPVILLARLAVHVDHQGQGLGRALVRHAMAKVAAVAEEVAVRALLVHAKDDVARSFYLSLAEFESSPTDPLHLLLLMKDLRAALGTSSVRE